MAARNRNRQFLRRLPCTTTDDELRFLLEFQHGYMPADPVRTAQTPMSRDDLVQSGFDLHWKGDHLTTGQIHMQNYGDSAFN